MNRKHIWLIALVVMALLVAACGPEMATPTPRDQASTDAPPATAAPAGETSEPEPVSSGDLPVDADDWHVLGPADAAATIVEYSDFQ